MIPPPGQEQEKEKEKEKEKPKKPWQEWTLGEVIEKASKIGMALVVGFSAAKNVISEGKEEKK